MTTEPLQTPTEPVEPKTEPAANPPAVAKNTEPAADHMIPKARFDEVNNELKKLRTAQAKAAKEQEEAERKRLEKQNEFETLYNDAQKQVESLTPFKERYEAHLTQTKERNEKRVSELPKEMQGLVPEYDDPLKLANWLDSNEGLLSKKVTAPSLDGGAGRTSGNSNALSLDEIKEQAARLNVNWQHLAKQYGVTVTN